MSIAIEWRVENIAISERVYTISVMLVLYTNLFTTLYNNKKKKQNQKQLQFISVSSYT